MANGLATLSQGRGLKMKKMKKELTLVRPW
jgi:hypothetical protein